MLFKWLVCAVCFLACWVECFLLVHVNPSARFTYTLLIICHLFVFYTISVINAIWYLIFLYMLFVSVVLRWIYHCKRMYTRLGARLMTFYLFVFVPVSYFVHFTVNMNCALGARVITSYLFCLLFVSVVLKCTLLTHCALHRYLFTYALLIPDWPCDVQRRMKWLRWTQKGVPYLIWTISSL